jgi:hypothetical protein
MNGADGPCDPGTLCARGRWRHGSPKGLSSIQLGQAANQGSSGASSPGTIPHSSAYIGLGSSRGLSRQGEQARRDADRADVDDRAGARLA